MDVVALRYWKPSTWSKPDLKVLVPSLVVGIGLGFLTLSVLDARAVAIVVALITLTFAGLWLLNGGKATVRPRSVRKGLGWRLHQRLDQLQLYRACYGLLIVTALKLLWDGVSGYLR